MNKHILALIFALSSTLFFGQNKEENKTNPQSTSDNSQETNPENKEESNFNLKGRYVTNFPIVKNDCNQEGKVVLEITVDKSGKVISAVNTDESNAPKCLIELSIKFALKTKWKPSETAPEKQVGKITYNYSF